MAGLATFGLLAWLGSGPAVQWLVAREGSRALAMRVTVDRARVGLVGPRLRLEGFALGNPPGFGDTNLEALRGRVHEALGRPPRSSRRVVIGRLVFRGGHASAPGPFGARITVPVKDIELSGVGEAKGGLTPIELADFMIDLMDPGLGNAVRNTDVGAMVKGLFK